MRQSAIGTCDRGDIWKAVEHAFDEQSERFGVGASGRRVFCRLAAPREDKAQRYQSCPSAKSMINFFQREESERYDVNICSSC